MASLSCIICVYMHNILEMDVMDGLLVIHSPKSRNPIDTKHCPSPVQYVIHQKQSNILEMDGLLIHGLHWRGHLWHGCHYAATIGQEAQVDTPAATSFHESIFLQPSKGQRHQQILTRIEAFFRWIFATSLKKGTYHTCSSPFPS